MKKHISFLMALMLLLSCIPFSGIMASATETGDGGTTTAADNGYRVSKEVSELNEEDGTYTITMKAWYEEDATVTIDPCDIVILFDQSSYAANQRSEIFAAAQNFLTQLQTSYSEGGLAPTDGSSHNVSLVGYGRINHTGESSSAGTGATIASANYNTGFYQSNGTFASTYTTRQGQRTGIFWVESNPPYMTTLSYGSTNFFMSASQASSILNNTYISKWNSGGARLDAGLVLTNQILSSVANDGRQKMVLVFTNSVAMLERSGTTELRVNYLQSTLETMKSSYGATFFVIGDLQATSPSSIQNAANFNTQTGLIASEDSDGNKRVYSYSNMADAFDDMLSMIEPASSAPTVKDTITPAFEIEKSDDDDYAIEVYTAPYTGRDGEGNPTFGDEVPAENCTVKVTAEESATEGTKQTLTVTGFDFGSNYVSDSPTHGNQIIIKVKTKVKEDFLGGSNVATNTSDSGIYDGDTLLAAFDSPQVDVGMPSMTASSRTFNVYLGEEIEDLKTFALKHTDLVIMTPAGKEIKISDLSQENWGLEPWQTAYLKLEADPQFTNLNEEYITEDLEVFTVDVKITDLAGEGGSVEAQGTEKALVFDPTFTYKDSTVYYGEDMPADFTANNLAYILWSREETGEDGQTVIIYSTDAGVEMQGEKPTTEGADPTIVITYSYDTSVLTEGRISTTGDIKVNAASVKINTFDLTELVSFAHQDCDEAAECTWNPEDTLYTKGNPAFLLHVIAGEIRITKEDGSDSSKKLPGAAFEIRDADGNLVAASEQTQTGADGTVVISPLASGTYTIVETRAPDGYVLNEAEETVTITLSDETKQSVAVTIKNRVAYALPSSGRSGTYLFTVSGVAIMMTTLLLFLLYQQKERRA